MIALFLLAVTIALPVYPASGPKVIVDVDLHYFADDHEALVMLANLHRRDVLRLLGVTLVAGNHRLAQIEVDTLRLVERLGQAGKVPVFSGADRPLLHSEQTFHQYTRKRYGSEYAGAWTQPKGEVTFFDGRPVAQVGEMHAAEFIIEAVRGDPGQITLICLGPLTNIALAFRLAPDIVSKIKQVIYMGGAVYAPGNVTPAAEFNWWFDAEAAAIVLGEPLRHIVVPLDATDKILFDREIYRRLVERYPSHRMTRRYLIPKFKQRFEKDPNYSIPVWDALVPAYLFDKSVVAEQRQLWLGIDANAGPGYGRVIALPASGNHGEAPFHGARKAEVILSMHEARFWEIYEQLIFQ